MRANLTIESTIGDFAKTETGTKALEQISKSLTYCGDHYVAACIEDEDGRIGDEILQAMQFTAICENGSCVRKNTSLHVVHNETSRRTCLVFSPEELMQFENLAVFFNIGILFLPRPSTIPEDEVLREMRAAVSTRENLNARGNRS